MSFLTPRLFSIADMVNIGEVVADIGTDHAYLPIYLAKQGKATKIYACDVAEKPLSVAKNNIASFGVQDKIELILSDGIKWTLDRDERIDTCIIAGMGSTTILKILELDNKSIDCYVIASNTSLEPIRKWVKEKKYFIEQERIVEDNEILYEVIKINKFAGLKVKNNFDILFGPLNRKKITNSFKDKWMFELNKLYELLTQIPKKEKKYKEVQKRVKVITKFMDKEFNKDE